MNMFDKRKVLRHRNGNNPYGLHDQYDQPLSRNKTIDYFNEIEINDEELISLNQYIKDDKENTFYNNPFALFEDSFTKCNYIDALRTHKDMEKEYLQRNFDFECSNGNRTWLVKVRDLKEFKGYVRLDIICNGNRFYTFAGNADGELWICFPQIDKSTTLSYPEDVFWNMGELFRLLKNEIDAISIAQSVKRIKDFINKDDDSFDIMQDDIMF